MSRRFAAATTRFLDRRTARRGFLTRSAVIGSAVAVAPVGYLLRPGTAYAQICRCNGSSCGCGQLCCDGYTEFCCTIYGTNGCPPGSLYGGWWKVSGSSFCGGRNRYYMDCHNPCDGCGCGASGVCSGSCNGTPCGCALGSCGNRKAGCTHFRYGQCNQQERCLGPIICRVVTCTPPWVLEPNCTRSVRTDPATAWHHRPCLEVDGGEPLGSLDRVSVEGGVLRVVGWAFDPAIDAPIAVNVTVNGTIVASARADQPRPDVGIAHPEAGDDHGFDVSFRVTNGTKQVCVYAVVAGRPNPILGCQTVTVRRRAVRGVVERVERTGAGVRVVGHAVRDDDRRPLDVEVLVDGVVVATALADRRRRDLGPALGAAGRDHGFDLTVPASRRSGRGELCVRAIDPDTRRAVDLGCRALPRAGVDIAGDVEVLAVRGDTLVVEGWVSADAGPVEIVVVAGGRRLARVRADETIANPAGRQVGATGFSIVTDVPDADRVCVYAFSSGERRLLACGRPGRDERAVRT